MPTKRIALALAVLPAFAVAQEPMSAIGWMTQEKPPGMSLPVLLEPPVTESAVQPQISTSPLEELAAPLGLVASGATGLPVDLWDGSDIGDLSALIASVPVQDSPAMQRLLFTLLLSESRPPRGTQAAETMLLARLDRLMELGATDPAQALVEIAGPTETSARFNRWFDATLLTGDEEFACARLTNKPHLSSDYAARIFCGVRAGDWQTAALTLEAAHALNLLPMERLDLLDRFLSPEIFDGAPALPVPDEMNPLDFRMREAIGERVPTTALPRAFATADLRDIAGWKAQLEAAERLTRIGALTPNQLLGLYTARDAAASGGVWDRVEAIQRLDTALATGSSDAVAKTLQPAWEAMQEARLAVPFATLFGPRLAVQSFDDPAAANLAWRIRLLSPEYQPASHTPPDNSSENTFLAALAQGAPGRALPPDALAQTIADGFDGATSVPEDMTRLIDAGRTGEAILRSMALFDRGARGNSADLVDALATFRALGLDDTARRAALQLMLTGAA